MHSYLKFHTEINFRFPLEWENEIRQHGRTTFLQNNNQIQVIAMHRCGYITAYSFWTNVTEAPAWLIFSKWFVTTLKKNEQIVKTIFLNIYNGSVLTAWRKNVSPSRSKEPKKLLKQKTTYSKMFEVKCASCGITKTRFFFWETEWSLSRGGQRPPWQCCGNGGWLSHGKRNSISRQKKRFEAGRYYASEAMRDPALQKRNKLWLMINKGRPALEKVWSRSPVWNQVNDFWDKEIEPQVSFVWSMLL